MSSHGVGTAHLPILIDDDSDTEVEAQVLPAPVVPHPQPQPAPLELSSTNKRPRGPSTPRAPRAMEEKRKGKKIASDTVGFQMLTRMGYEPGKGLGLELEGPSEPLVPEHRPVFNQLGLGGVPANKFSPIATSAPELEQGDGSAKPLTKKQRKLVAQAERLAQARTQPQAGPSKLPKLKTTPRAPRAMIQPVLAAQDPMFAKPSQDDAQTEEDDATFFMQQPATFFPNPQAAMQLQMAQMGMGMGIPFFQPMFDPMMAFPMDASFLAANQGMAFNPEFFVNQFGAPITTPPVLPTEPRASGNRPASTQKPPSSPHKTTALPDTTQESGSLPDKGGEQMYTIRGIMYRPSLGPIGVHIQAPPDTDYSTRNGGVPGCFKYYPELSFTADPNRTIVLETMPRKLRTLDFVHRWIAQFAEADPPVKASQVLLRETKALVEFNTEAGAARAFASPRMNGNGGQPGIRAYAYLRPGEKPREAPFVKLAMASPQWKDVVTPRDILIRSNELLVRPPSKLFEPEDEDVSRQLAARREKGKEKVPQLQIPVQINDDLEEGELVETLTAPSLPAKPPSRPTTATTPVAPKACRKSTASMKLDNKSSGGEAVASTSGANQDPVPLSANSVVQDNAAYEAALRNRIKTRALKRSRDEAFGPQPPPPPSATPPSLPPPLAPAILPTKPVTIPSSSASSSRSTSTPALTPTSATFSISNIPRTPGLVSLDPATAPLPSTLITLDAEAFLMDTLRDAKRQRVLPDEPHEAFVFHCARRDALLNEFNAVMAKQTAAYDRENKRALSAHLKEIMADLELTRKAVNEAKALVDALKATPTPAPPSPVAQRRVSPPSRISMSPQPPAYDIHDIVGDVLPTTTPGCVFPNPTDDSLFIFTWEDDDDEMDGE